MKSIVKKNVSLFLFFLTFFSDTILSSNFLFSLSVNSDISESLSDTLLDDYSDALKLTKQVKRDKRKLKFKKDRKDPLRSKKRFNDSGEEWNFSTHSERTVGFYDDAKTRTVLTIAFLISLILTILFFSIGLNLYSIGDVSHLILVLLGSISFCFASMSLAFILIRENSSVEKVLFLFFAVSIILAILFYILFAFAFPNYLFLFIFSIINFSIMGLIWLIICIRGKFLIPFLVISTILFTTVGLTAFSMGAPYQMAYLIFAALSFWLLLINLAFISIREDSSFEQVLFRVFALSIILAIFFYLLFAFVFPNYSFLFIFSIINFSIMGLIWVIIVIKGKSILPFLMISTILFTTVGLTAFSMGAAYQMAYLIFAALSFWSLLMNLALISIREEFSDNRALFPIFAVSIILATFFYLLFVFVFPYFLFLFVFSMINFGIFLLIWIRYLLYLKIKDKMFLSAIFLGILLCTLGLTIFSMGSIHHLIAIIFGSISFLGLFLKICSFARKRIGNRKFVQFFLDSGEWIVPGVVFFLLFSFVFPSYYFLFVFSMISFGISGLVFFINIFFYFFVGEIIIDEDENGAGERVLQWRADLNEEVIEHLGVGSQFFNRMVLLTVSLWAALLGLAFLLLQQFFFPVVSLLSFMSYGFFGLSTLLFILFVGTLSYRFLKERSLRPDFGQGNASSFLILFFVGLALILIGTLLYFFVESLDLSILIISTVLGGVFSLFNLFKFFQTRRLSNNDNDQEISALKKFPLYNKTSALGLLSFLLASSLFILYLLSYGSFTTVFLPMLVFIVTAFLLFGIRIVSLARVYHKSSSVNETSSGVIEDFPVVLSSRITLAWIIGLHFFLIFLIFLGLSFMLSVVLQVPIVSMLSIFYTVFVLQIFFVYFFLGKKQGVSSGDVFSKILTWFKDQSAKIRAKFNQDRRNSVRSKKSFNGSGEDNDIATGLDKDSLLVKSFSEYFSQEQMEIIDELLPMNVSIFSKTLGSIDDALFREFYGKHHSKGERGNTPMQIVSLLATNIAFFYDISRIASSLSEFFEDPENLRQKEELIDSKILNALQAFYIFFQNFALLDNNYERKFFYNSKFNKLYFGEKLEARLREDPSRDLPSIFLECMELKESDALKKMNKDFVSLKKALKSA